MGNIISRGCTVVNRIHVPFSSEGIEVMYVTYQQAGENLLEKEGPDCKWGEDEKGNFFEVPLSQEDTLKFEQPLGIISVQIRIRTVEGTSLKSNVMFASTDILLKEGVI